jgi:alkylated DNA nucleotide flippase Atl1
MHKPYTDDSQGDTITRTFDESIDPIELMWHRDLNDRTVIATHITDWKVQFDNQLPAVIKDSIFIPKMAWHRVIKGTGALTVNIKEHD